MHNGLLLVYDQQRTHFPALRDYQYSLPLMNISTLIVSDTKYSFHTQINEELFQCEETSFKLPE